MENSEQILYNISNLIRETDKMEGREKPVFKKKIEGG